MQIDESTNYNLIKIMKKIIYLLFVTMLFAMCNSNEQNKEATVDTRRLSDLMNDMTSIHIKMVSVQKEQEEQMKIKQNTLNQMSQKIDILLNAQTSLNKSS